MASKLKQLPAFFADESGATAVEYGLITAIVCIGIIASLTQLSNELKGAFNRVSAGFAAS
jgi:pilus assembly protein Flp/PilA